MSASTQISSPASRIDWVDAAKGICIILVVMMHATLGVQDRMGAGFMDWPVAFAQPFRMPDFFLLSGLFLAATINRPWALYADRKIVHFAYFYVLWF
ncbi:MAG: acyltransferase family protein, partial [Pseudomonadota bacterium]